jgi:hypothetical protein
MASPATPATTVNTPAHCSAVTFSLSTAIASNTEVALDALMAIDPSSRLGK